MSKETTKNYGKSIRSKLLNISKEENIFHQTILTRYFQERLLYRMSQTKYRNNFYLKGGALMYAYERFAARPTLDIDFLGNNISNEGKSISAAFKEICSVPFEEDGITFDTDHITEKNITEFKDYHGVRLSIPVRMDSIAQVLTMDIGFGDVVTPSAVELDYPVLLEHLPKVTIMAYSLETAIAEKFHAIISLADQNSRMKDYYDLHKLLSKEKYNSVILQEAIERTFENRHTSYDANTMFFRRDFSNNQQMQVKWIAFLRKITMDDKLPFSDVVTFIQNELRPYWENLQYAIRKARIIGLTPLLRQYMDFKKDLSPDIIPLFHVSGGYETYQNDAERVAKVLGLPVGVSQTHYGPDGNPARYITISEHDLEGCRKILLDNKVGMALLEDSNLEKDDVKDDSLKSSEPLSHERNDSLDLGKDGFRGQHR